VTPELTKIDIKHYLEKLYSIKISNVRTMNYLGRQYRREDGQKAKRADYKKAIVTMRRDFVFPPLPDLQKDGAVELPPPMEPGRGVKKAYRDKIAEYNKRRNYTPPETASSSTP
jgi:hypothetical protein